MKIESPYHEGEIRIQALTGERDIALLNGGGVGDRIVPPAFRFLAQLRLFVLGQADAEHGSEATILFGAPGFLQAEEDGKVLSIALDPARDRAGDPVLGALAEGRSIGGLAIDLQTRRRLRINGRVLRASRDRLLVDVRESYANCPKYIQKRTVELAEDASSATGESLRGIGELPEPQRAIIRAADTFFVVTSYPEGYADASHRGGSPGFVRVEDDGTLAIPDYIGNSMYSTLGNIATDPRAALVFLDFEEGKLLHLGGRATLHFGEDPLGLDTGSTGRFWRFRVERWIEQRVPAPFRLRLVERSPFNPIL